MSYPDLELYLFSPFEKGIQSSVFASVYFGNATSVTEAVDNKLLAVYPNPTSGLLNIELMNNEMMTGYRLYDALGRLIQSESLPSNANSHQIDVSHKAPGMYTLQVLSYDKIITKRFVIE
ncbi:MAG: T9SS type A sorting domain-containing protein [Saprospiraceae bacterium]